MVGLGVDFGDVADYVAHNDLGTALLLRALAARRFAGPLRPGVEHGRLRRGPLRCAEHGDVAPGPRASATWRPAASSRRARAAARALAAASRCPRTRRSIRATSTRRPSSIRSTCCARSPARRRRRPVTALRYHNVYGPRMPRDTPYAGVASHLPLGAGARARRRACSRTASSSATSSTSPTSPTRTCWRWRRATLSVRGPFNVAIGLAAQRGRHGPRAGRRDPRRSGAGGHRCVPPRRRPPRVRLRRGARAVLGFSAGTALDEGMAEFAHAELRRPARAGTQSAT